MEKQTEVLKSRRDSALKGWEYSIERIDVLIISISGGGVYLCLDAMKAISKQLLPYIGILKYSGVLFAFAIILNIISQYTGSKSNWHCYKACNEKLKGENWSPSVAVKEEKLGNDYDTATTWFNNISILLMLSALFALIAYFVLIF